jgi:hypothetical protein
MAKVDIDWVKQQFAKAKVRVGIGMAVLELLKTWETINLKGKDAEQALKILSQVGLGHALVSEGKDLWIDAQAGFMKVGETVRVKADAFEGDLGVLHNGREGTVVALRSGDVIVNSTDELTPALSGAHYRPDKLQKLVKRFEE